MTSVEFTLMYRQGCHLCEDMESSLEQLLEAGSYSLKRVDIDRDPALQTRYNERVPVLFHGDNEICHHFLDLKAVRAVLASYNTQIDCQ